MTDERLGLAAGAVLRDQDRPAVDPRRSVERLMAEVRVTPQARRSRWWSSPRGGTSPMLAPGTVVSQDHPTDKVNGRTSRPAPAQIGGSRTMFGAMKPFLAGLGVALVSILLVSGVLPSGLQVPGAGTPASDDAPSVGWTTDRVALFADDVRLEVNDLEFGDDVWPRSLDSDPGRSDYWTLEVVWLEHDVEQRLNMYFGSDGTDWWVDEIRTYDGHERGEWVYAYGPFFRTPLGEAFEGDVTVELLGEGRPDDPENLVPAVLSFDGLRLAVSPGDGRGPSSSDPEAVNVADGDAVVEGTAGLGDERNGPDEEYPSAEAAMLERALMAAIGEPQAGGRCLSVEEAHDVAADVLVELGLTQVATHTASGVRDDECATFSVAEDEEGMEVVVLTAMRPDVRGVLDGFFELSLGQCLDADSAVGMLTQRLDDIGHTDFVVKVDSMLGGPSDRTKEITAHAEAGCVFYVGSGAEADGTRVYFLHGA